MAAQIEVFEEVLLPDAKNKANRWLYENMMSIQVQAVQTVYCPDPLGVVGSSRWAIIITYEREF
jgi:uncharacterized membrane protein